MPIHSIVSPDRLSENQEKQPDFWQGSLEDTNRLTEIDLDDKCSNLRVLIVAEYASQQMGGEAVLTLQYFQRLRRLGIEAWLLTHEGCLPELQQLLPHDSDRLYTSPDLVLHRLFWYLQQRLPDRLGSFTFGTLRRFLNQLLQRGIAKRLIPVHGITVIHQPIPVSPREPSWIYGLGVPVVIGPMNGAMSYPQGFQQVNWRGVNAFLALGRSFSQRFNQWIPGKLQAAVLLVANERTRQALPQGVQGQVRTLVDNGVDFQVWQPQSQSQPQIPLTAALEETQAETRPLNFVFVGRLVRWKGVDFLLRAFAAVVERSPQRLELAAQPQLTPQLTIVGDGPQRGALEALARELGLLDVPGQADRVRFLGWLHPTACAAQVQQATALVLPSLLECGGAVVLEAMALGRPVIATNWGGPADYLDASCGILVEPTEPQQFVAGLCEAMLKLAADPAWGDRLGSAAYNRVRQQFDWDRKMEAIVEIYQQVVNSQARK